MPLTLIQSHIDALRRKIRDTELACHNPMIRGRLRDIRNELELLEAALSKEAAK